jgi:hypothetical protein
MLSLGLRLFERADATRSRYTLNVSTIKAILEPQADGTVHLPLPPELRQGRLNVTATVEPVPPAPPNDATNTSENLNGFGCLQGKIWMAPDFDEPLEDFKDYME